MKYRNIHSYPLKFYPTGEEFAPGEEFEGRGVHPDTLKSWLKRVVIEAVEIKPKKRGARKK